MLLLQCNYFKVLLFKLKFYIISFLLNTYLENYLIDSLYDTTHQLSCLAYYLLTQGVCQHQIHSVHCTFHQYIHMTCYRKTYSLTQKYHRIDRQEHNTADKRRGYDRTKEGVDVCAEPVALLCLTEGKIEATFVTQGKHA